MSLTPGMLCEIVPTEFDKPHESDADGRTVVLIEEYTLPIAYITNKVFNPYWRCSGLPSNLVGISHVKLRPLPPPPPLEEDIPTLDEVVV
jgi:hypothetical protein